MLIFGQSEFDCFGAFSVSLWGGWKRFRGHLSRRWISSHCVVFLELSAIIILPSAVCFQAADLWCRHNFARLLACDLFLVSKHQRMSQLFAFCCPRLFRRPIIGCLAGVFFNIVLLHPVKVTLHSAGNCYDWLIKREVFLYLCIYFLKCSF